MLFVRNFIQKKYAQKRCEQISDTSCGVNTIVAHKCAYRNVAFAIDDSYMMVCLISHRISTFFRHVSFCYEWNGHTFGHNVSMNDCHSKLHMQKYSFPRDTICARFNLVIVRSPLLFFACIFPARFASATTESSRKKDTLKHHVLQLFGGVVLSNYF